MLDNSIEINIMVGRNSDVEIEAQKKNIANKILDQIFTTSENNKGTSDVWKIYRIILDETQNKVKGFVWCSLCETVRVYNDKGTQPLRRHKEEHETEKQRRSSQTLINEYVEKLKKKFTSKTREDVRDTATEYVVRDSRPFESVTGVGLIRLLMLFSQIGERFGHLTEDEVKYLLPDPTTVRLTISLYDTNIFPSSD